MAYTIVVVAIGLVLAMVGCGEGLLVVVQSTVNEYAPPCEVEEEAVHPVVTHDALLRVYEY